MLFIVNECPPSSFFFFWLFFFPQDVPAIYPTFQLGFSEAQRGRTCLSLYSESTAQQGIRAHNPAGIAALARTTGPCSLVSFLVLSAGMWFVRKKASVWLIKEALYKAVNKKSLPRSSASSQSWWCRGQAPCVSGTSRIPEGLWRGS